MISLRPREYLLIILVMAVWGANFVAIRVGVESVPPLLLTALRFFFTAVPAVFFLRKPDVAWRWLILFGLLLGLVKFGLVFSAIKLGMAAGLTSLLMQLQVFFTLGLAFLVFAERPSSMQLLGAFIAFGGIGLFAYERAQGTLPLIPFLMIIAASLAWGCANIVVKRAGRVDMLAFLCWSSLFSPLPLFALSIMVDGPAAIISSLSPPAMEAVLALAFIVGPSTLFAFAVWINLLMRHPTSAVAPFALLVPVFGILSGVIALGEAFSPLSMIGSAVVFTGLMINVFGERIRASFKASP